MKEEVQVESTTFQRVRRASWGSIFAGMFVTIVLQIMLTLLGIAIGIATIEPLRGQTSAQTMALGSGIWLLVTGLISIWLGAWVAGRLSGGPLLADGMLHGIVAWCVSMLAMFYLLATAVGAVLGGTGALVGGAMAQSSESGQSPVAALGDELKAMFPQAGKLLPPTGRTENEQVPGQITKFAAQDPELADALAKLEKDGGVARSPQDRDAVFNLLTSKHNMNQQDASSLLNQWDEAFQQEHANAGQVGNEAAKGLSQGALWGFIALIWGCSLLPGVVGPEPLHSRGPSKPCLRQPRRFELLPLLYRDVVIQRRPHIHLPRTIYSRRGFHDFPVIGNPSRHTPNREDHREHFQRDPDSAHNNPTVKIHVRIQLPLHKIGLFQSGLFQMLGNVQQRV
jgi:hypothetical protein